MSDKEVNVSMFVKLTVLKHSNLFFLCLSCLLGYALWVIVLYLAFHFFLCMCHARVSAKLEDKERKDAMKLVLNSII